MANSSCPPCTPLIQDPPSTGEDPTVLGPCSQNRPHNNFPHFSMLISSHREVQLLKMLINCNSLHPLHNHGGKEGAKNLSQIFLVRPQKWTPISPPQIQPAAWGGFSEGMLEFGCIGAIACRFPGTEPPCWVGGRGWALPSLHFVESAPMAAHKVLIFQETISRRDKDDMSSQIGRKRKSILKIKRCGGSLGRCGGSFGDVVAHW